MPKAVVPRELARRDADEAIDYYLSENACGPQNSNVAVGVAGIHSCGMIA